MVFMRLVDAMIFLGCSVTGIIKMFLSRVRKKESPCLIYPCHGKGAMRL